MLSSAEIGGVAFVFPRLTEWDEADRGPVSCVPGKAFIWVYAVLQGCQNVLNPLSLFFFGILLLPGGNVRKGLSWSKNLFILGC
jgi:hypothetical protein